MFAAKLIKFRPQSADSQHFRLLTAGSLSDGEEERDACSPEIPESLDADEIYQYLHEAAHAASGRKSTIHVAEISNTGQHMYTDRGM